MIDASVPGNDLIETSLGSSPGDGMVGTGATQDIKGKSTVGMRGKVSAACGKRAVGTCGGGNPVETSNPTPVVDQSGSRNPTTVHRVSINTVTIKTPVMVQGRNAVAVVDSGAEITVLSSHFYASIPPVERPSLQMTTLLLVVADQGRELKSEGASVVRIKLHNLTFDWPMHVAPITDDLLLGSDVLDAQDIVVSSHRGLLIQDTWISCETIRRPIHIQHCHVRTPGPLVVQPQHELVISVPWEVQRKESKLVVLEPLVEDSRGLLIARSLVDPQGGCIPVRMANLSTEPKRLQKGHPLGELHGIQDEIVSFDQKPMRVRGVGCCSKMAIPDDDSASSLSIEEANDRTADAETSKVQLPDPETEAQDLPEYLGALYITTAQGIRQQLRVMLCHRKGAFAQHKLDLGRFSSIPHEINTACAAPVRARVRPKPRGFEDEEQKCLEEQLEAGVIRPSSSTWAAPTVLVRKTDGSLSWCIDYRKLNDRSVKEAYPLPKISMCLDSLSGARYFLTLDLQSGYWQIEMAEKDIPKTAFITNYGLFEYTKMPFELCSAPSTFQRCMELVF